MKNAVLIKGNKSGMTVFLDPDISFEQLLNAISIKFTESAKFWGSVQMTLTLEGRALTPQEEFQIINMITEHSQIEILCLIDRDANRMRECEKALNEKLMELSSTTGQFYRGNLRAGETLESETSIVIIGDICHGAKVTAKGNVIVLGELNGTVIAGVAGNEDTVIVAFEMAPVQLRISDYSTRFQEKGKRLGKGPMMACIENNTICLKTIKKSFFNMLKNI
ncbi:MAG: septum site-determining protein MinC [Hungatella sp.]